jgi:hypothetical protein
MRGQPRGRSRLAAVETQLPASQGVQEVEGTSGAVERSHFREWRWETALQGESCSLGGAVSPAS